ncbi:MAG: hypothetical protein P8181_00260 [bacterium]
MKRSRCSISLVIVMTMIIGVMAACEQSRVTEVNVPKTPDEPVVIVDPINQIVTITDPVQPHKPLIIEIDSHNRTQSFRCGEFTLMSADNWISTSTPDDYFEASFEPVDEFRHRERYYLNGRVLEFLVDDRRGPAAEQIQAYRDFYENSQALDSNADARVMADLLQRSRPALIEVIQQNDPELNGRWLAAGLGDEGEPELRPRWLDMTCAAAYACTMIACKIFPLINPVCWVCMGVALGCLIISIF